MRTSIKQRLARRIINQSDYKTRRLSACNSDIIFYNERMRGATTSTEKKFCADMIAMYRKRYDWYLKDKTSSQYGNE